MRDVRVERQVRQHEGACEENAANTPLESAPTCRIFHIRRECKSNILKGERIGVCPFATFRGLRPRHGKAIEGLPMPLTATPCDVTKELHVKPAPIHLAIDSAHKRAARIFAGTQRREIYPSLVSPVFD